MVVKIAFVALFFAVTLLLGLFYQKKVKSMEDFVLGRALSSAFSSALRAL